MGGVISVLRIFSKSHLPPMAPGAMLRAAGSPAVSNPFENIPRWQLLSALAIPVGLGLGYLYYRQRQTPPIAKPPNTVPDPVIPHQRALSMKEKGHKLFKSGRIEDAIAAYSAGIVLF